MTNSIAFIGVMSAGKDVIGVKFLRWCLANKRKRVIANCWLNLGDEIDFIRLTTEELYLKHKEPEFFRDSYLYITELHTILESRSSNALINKNFTMFLTQIGKLGCKVIYTSQLQGQIDLRLREWTPYMFLCERLVRRNGVFRSPDFFDGRKLEEQIYIRLTLVWENLEGKEVFKEIGLYMPTQEDFSVFDTEEIVVLDREQFMRK